jgi:hypothetical protein
LASCFAPAIPRRPRPTFLIFLQPHILRTDEQASEETDAKYNYIRDQQRILNHDKRVIPFQPFAPADPLPQMKTAASRSGILSPDFATSDVMRLRPAPQRLAAAALPRRRTPFTPDTPAVTAPAPTRSRLRMRHQRESSECRAERVADDFRLPFTFARRHGVIVLSVESGIANCAYKAPASPFALAEARRFLRLPVKLSAVDSEAFDLLLRKTYEGGTGDSMQQIGLEDTTDLAHLAQELPEQADLLESDDDAPIIRLINAVLTQAIRENASDIHIEPFENRLVVRFRVDGILREVLQSKRGVAPLVVSRIKVMSKLDIAEKRSAAGRTHQPAYRRSRGRRACLDHSFRSRRARGAATAGQAGRSTGSGFIWAWRAIPRNWLMN